MSEHQSVAFWTGSTDGSSFYRADQPADALKWNGHKAWVGEVLPASVIANADTIVGSRVARPEASETWLKLAAEGRHRLVLDLDDNYFDVEPRNRAASAFWRNDQAWYRLKMNCLAADTVTVCSNALAEVVDKATGHHDIQVIPNGLHAGYLSMERDYEAADRPLVIGWSGSMATAEDFDLIATPLARILDYAANHWPDGEIRGQLIGMPSGHPSVMSHPGLLAQGKAKRLDGIEWIDGTPAYLSHVARFDIWLAPYRSNPFTDAKFPTKALEAGMLGIPLIASDIRPYREWITHGVNGFLVHPDRPWEWGRALKTLVDSPATRQRMGEAARARAAFNSMQSLALLWEEVLLR